MNVFETSMDCLQNINTTIDNNTSGYIPNPNQKFIENEELLFKPQSTNFKQPVLFKPQNEKSNLLSKPNNFLPLPISSSPYQGNHSMPFNSTTTLTSLELYGFEPLCDIKSQELNKFHPRPFNILDNNTIHEDLNNFIPRPNLLEHCKKAINEYKNTNLFEKHDTTFEIIEDEDVRKVLNEIKQLKESLEKINIQDLVKNALVYHDKIKDLETKNKELAETNKKFTDSLDFVENMKLLYNQEKLPLQSKPLIHEFFNIFDKINTDISKNEKEIEKLHKMSSIVKTILNDYIMLTESLGSKTDVNVCELCKKNLLGEGA